MTDDPTPVGGNGEPEKDWGDLLKRLGEHAREKRRERERRLLLIGLGIAAGVYVVFLLGMSAGQSWVTKCVRSHRVDVGSPDSYTVCDFRVANGRGIDIGTPFAWLGIPHIPGGPHGIIGYGLVLVVVVVGVVLTSRASRANRGETSSGPH